MSEPQKQVTEQPTDFFAPQELDKNIRWDKDIVEKSIVQVLVSERKIEPDTALVISQNVEEEVKSEDQLTPRKILNVLNDKMVELGFEKKIRLSSNAIQVLNRRYLKKDNEGKILETPKHMFDRVAKTVASADTNFLRGRPEAEKKLRSSVETFYQMMTELDFIPNSPTLMNAGRELGQLSACFVLPVEDSMESIFEAIKSTALIHKSGGGTGFSFSRIRPKNDVVLSTKGVSSGPISFMRVFDMATDTIKQGGTRRGANMGILNVNHPDILEFISCKEDHTQFNNFNISVGITEDFMEAIENDQDYTLVNPRTGDPMGQYNAKEVFNKIVDMAWKNGEPGIIFLDRINRTNPVLHVGKVESTNPCGEQPLLPYESCNLGSINLARMIKNEEVDWTHLKKVVHDSVHFLDNVIEINKFPLSKIQQQTFANRKIGLGIMGFAEMLIKMNIPYNSDRALQIAEDVMQFINLESKIMSRQLAEERGGFPNFRGSSYDQSDDSGIRNATTTTIAPTGTISMIAGCSSGIEPLFAISFIKNVMDNDELVEVNPLFEKMAKERGFYSQELMKKIAKKGSLKDIDSVPEDIKRVFVTAMDITPEWHIRMQAAFQKHVDNAVSKTVNFPESATKQEVGNAFRMAYTLGCKGVTVYRYNSRPAQVLNIGKVNRKEGEQSLDQQLAFPSKLIPRDRPEIMRGSTQMINTGCGHLYITINEDEHGPFELFTAMGKAGGCAASQAEAIGRLISLSFRVGVATEEIIKQLSAVRCPAPAWANGEQVLSCADAIAKALRRYTTSPATEVGQKIAPGQALTGKSETTNSVIGVSSPVKTGFVTCPECGSQAIANEDGCATCKACAWSKCS